ncbi:hypothetical protein [Chryseobacterium sp. 'Rf worker isolate 10']|uniref:hypothetical protein n=1 Tax=Chryseobacterium sp. 'Rf worker isolate 10' TaxID=2887348 RepID=UPI003D6EF000
MINKILSTAKLLYIFTFFLLTSCTSQKNNNEYIQLNHENVMFVKGDKLTITLLPADSKRKKPVIVKILKNDQQYNNKRITLVEYQKIYELIIKTNQKDIELPRNPNVMISITDGGNNSIILKKDTLTKKLYSYGISKEYHGKFYESIELILKVAGLNIREIN